MGFVWFVHVMLLQIVYCATGFSGNVSSRPSVVNIGAIFTFNSTIGRVSKIAIEQAVKDVNSNSSVLPHTKLILHMQNSNCRGFLGMVEALQFMETDIIAIIGPQSSVIAHLISFPAKELQIPLLSFAATDPTLSSLQDPFFVRTIHSDSYQMAAVAEIVDYYDWRDVIAIFIDDDYGRNGVLALNDVLASKRCKVSYKAGIPPGPSVSRDDIMDILIKVALLQSRVIVIHANSDSGFMVFNVAHYLGMMGNGYVWIATDWLSSVLDSSPHIPSSIMDTLQGVLVLRTHSQDSGKKTDFISKWRNLTSGSIGLNSYGLYAYDTVWLLANALDSFFNQGGVILFSNNSKLQAVEGNHLHLDAMSVFNDGPILLENILKTSFIGLTGPIKFNPDKSLLFPAYDVINVAGTGIRRIGYWSNYSGLSIIPPEELYLLPPNRSSANQKLRDVIWPGDTTVKPRGWVFPSTGKLLKIGVPDRVSYKEFVSRIRGTNMFKGFCIDVFTAAVSLLPYAVPYEFVPFGNGKHNPSYTDLINKVASGDLDGAVGDIAITTNRTMIVDFTQPYAASGLLVLVPYRKVDPGGLAFLRPFTWLMWGVTAAFFFVVGLVVWILEHRINDEFRGTPKEQFITIIWFSISTLFFAHRENTVTTLGRVVLIIWLFVVLIISSSYTANLTSILTVQQLYSPIKGIQTLKENDDPIGYQVGSFAEHYLNVELGIPESRLVPLGTPEAYFEALQRGPKKEGVGAVVDERPYIELFLSSQCKFRIVGQEFTKSGWGFAFPRDSPLAVDLSTAILALSENGELQRIHDKWLIKSSCSLDSTEIDSDRLHLKSFWGLFLICGVACIVALLIFFFQIIQKYRRTQSLDSITNGEGSSRSNRMNTLLSIIDKKKDPSKREGKKRKVECLSTENK